VSEPEIQWRLPPPARWSHCPLCAGPLTDRELDGRERRHCRACGFVYWEAPRPAAAAVVEGPEGIVCVRRRYPPEAGGWCLPGGFVEAGETIEDAARREVREETGLEVAVHRQLGVFGPVIAFVAARPTGGRLCAGTDALEAAAFPPATLPALCFSSHRLAVCAWHAGGH